MARYLRADRIRDIQLAALSKGGTIRSLPGLPHSRTVEWDIARDCINPAWVSLHGRPEGQRTVTAANPSRFVEMWVACRKCERCLRRRAAMWRLRAVAEWRMSPRTWLATMTLRPDAYHHMQSLVRRRLDRGGTDWDGLSSHDKFCELEGEGYSNVQLWLKRLRKNTGSPIRYLSVTEAHKSGVPHWHLLIHEQDPDRPIRHKSLSGSWQLGFDDYRLVHDSTAASYAAKYLGKDISARVRASGAYGRRDEAP